MAKLLDYIFSKYMKSLCSIGLGDDREILLLILQKWKVEIFFPALDKFIKCEIVLQKKIFFLR